MPNLATIPRTEMATATVGAAQYEAGSVGPAALAANVVNRRASSGPQTVPTTGAVEFPMRAPCAGTIVRIAFFTKDALAQHATNYVTFTAINYVSGAGSTALLAATDANTTKTSTGTAISAHTSRLLTLTVTSADLVVAAGDLIVVVVTAAATSANAMTFSGVELSVAPS